ncbi:host specificity protein J [Pseudomonas putida]
MSSLAIRGSKGSSSTHTPVESPDSLINTSYANILDAISEGPIVGLVNGAQSIYFDQTPLANADGSLNFTGVTWEQRTGEAEQDYISGFPAVEAETSVGIELKASQAWTQALSNIQLSAVRIRLGASSLYQTESDGDTVGYTVEYAVDLATDGGDYATVLSTSFVGKTTSGYQRSHRIELPKATMGWQIRVRRITADSTSSSIVATTTVISYTEVIDAKLQYPYTALVGVKVDASQFSAIPERAYRIRGRTIQVPANYDPSSRSYTGTWDGTFKIAWTDNPAWIYRDLVLNDRYGLGRYISDSQVDKWGLYQIAQYCDVMVSDGKGGTEPRFTCNLYLQSQNDALSVLQDMASIFRGMSYYAASEVVVSADMPSDPVYTYTNGNVVNGKFSRAGSSGSTRYSVCKVAWSDRDNFGNVRTEYVQDQKSLARYGIRDTSITAFGCGSQGQAQRLGQYTILTNQLETDTISFSVGLDGTIARPGQIVRVADENFAGRPIGGRVKAATGNTVTLDSDVQAAAGDTLVIILPTGTAQTRVIQSIADRVVTVTQAFSSVPVAESVFAIETAELVPEVYRILTVSENFGDDKLQYDIVAVQHNASKFAAIDNGAKIVYPPTTVLPSAIQAVPTNIQLSTFDAVKQGLTVATMRVTWDVPKGAASYNVWWRRNSGDWTYAGVTYTNAIEVSGIYTGTYTARVSAVGASGNSSLWGYSDPTDLMGKTGLPPALASFSTVSEVWGIRINWEFPASGAEDTLYTEIQESLASSGDEPTQLGLISYPTKTYLKSGMAAGVTRFFRARLSDRIGNTGAWTDWVMGQSGADAGPILTYIAGQIGRTELGQDLLDEIDKIPGLQDQIDALDNILVYDPEKTYLAGDMVQEGQRLYQATQVVPANTPPPNAAYWLDIGQVVATANGLAEQVQINTASIEEIDGVITSQASALQILQAATRDDDGDGELDDAIKGWTSTAAIATESKVRTSENEALAQRLTTFDATIDENTANITELEQVVADTNSATATKLDSLTAAVGDNTSQIQQTATAYADTAGKLSTMWSVKMTVNANGQYVAAGIGLGIENVDGQLQSQFLVSADRFAVLTSVAGGTAFVPFAVQGGQVFMNSAFIQDGTITNAKIGSYISSTNYIAGQSGWILSKDGTLEINGVVAGGGRLTITNRAVKVYDASGVLRVQLGDLTA